MTRKTWVVVLALVFLTFVWSGLFASNVKVKKAITLEELDTKVTRLERQVKMLESKLGRVQLTHMTKGKTKRSGAVPVGYDPYRYPFHGRGPYMGRQFRDNTEYTHRTYERIYHPEQADRNNYERRHGGDYVSPDD